ncbi:porin family protein [Neolewinella lacunae]|uniref:PorT family protein n=1 Tax=Neolewinella lacunae TaxID=1517758 RepID=A0A923T7N8_9BACT|nr:porin family protein [Neolewinella lacunae]MBC6994720.1 PorT family protein [Neolewinella lacunae]MDN3634592.1 porin family protein [Neolewinella lacunae]
MRKLFFTLAAAVLLTSGLSAQYFGLRAGVNSTNAKVDFENAEIDTDGETNLMLGIFLDLPLGTDLISIQPELNYLNRGYSLSADFGPAGSFDQTISYIDLGGLLKLNFGREEGLGFYLGAGPMFSYAVSGQRTVLGDETDIDFDADRINRGELQFAGVAGLTIDLGLKLFVEGRYNGSFSDQSDLDDSEIRQRSIGINGGVLVPLGN